MPGGAIESWTDFLARAGTSRERWSRRPRRRFSPATPAPAVLLLRLDQQAQGHPERASRRHDPDVALRAGCTTSPRRTTSGPGAPTASSGPGNFGMALGNTLTSGGTLVLQRTFDPVEALELMEAERVNFPFAWPHQWAQLEAAPNWRDVDLSSMLFTDYRFAIAHHPTVSGTGMEPGHAYGNTETFTHRPRASRRNSPQEVHAGQQRRGPAGQHVQDRRSADRRDRAARRARRDRVKGPTLMLRLYRHAARRDARRRGLLPHRRRRLCRRGRPAVLGGPAHRHHQDRRRQRLAARGRRGACHAIPASRSARRSACRTRRWAKWSSPASSRTTARALDAEEIRAFLQERLASYKVPRRVLFFGEDEISTHRQRQDQERRAARVGHQAPAERRLTPVKLQPSKGFVRHDADP